jgi:hypothetical protein
MIARDRGDIVFQCDDCGELLETLTGNFGAARNLMKREGWCSIRLQVEGEDWSHFCSKCKDHPL